MLFCVAEREYEERLGCLWAVKGEPPSEGLPNLVKLTPPHFTCYAAFWGTIWGSLKCMSPHSTPATSATSTPLHTRSPERRMKDHE